MPLKNPVVTKIKSNLSQYDHRYLGIINIFLLDYECGNEISDDCESEYNNGDLDSFYSRCETEGGSSPLRARCALCCNQGNLYLSLLSSQGILTQLRDHFQVLI